MFQLLGLLILRDMLRPLSHLWALLENKAIRKTHKNIGNTSILLKHPTVLAPAAPHLKFELRDVCDLDSPMHQLNFFWLRRNAESSVYGRAKGCCSVQNRNPNFDQNGDGLTQHPAWAGCELRKETNLPQACLEVSSLLCSTHFTGHVGLDAM